jgi:class 3 adenylate cyclase
MWAVVFTDVVDSTALRARVGDEAADGLRREHDEIVLVATDRRDGHVVKSTGDGSMFVFASPADAVAAAVEVQQAIERRNRGDEERLGLRMGISVGDLAHEDGDLFGLAVNEAARLCALADGGEILLSDLGRVVGGSRMERDLIDRGVFELKGLPEPVRVWAVVWNAAPSPAPVPLPARMTVEYATPMVGRDIELTSLGRTVRDAGSGRRRLVLMAGEPGMGKTRLTTEAARIAHQQGATVLYGRCDEELGVPYQPWVEALAHLVELEADGAIYDHTDNTPLSVSCARTSMCMVESSRGWCQGWPDASESFRRRHRAMPRPSGICCSVRSLGCSGLSAGLPLSCWCSTICTGPTGRRCCCYVM